MGHQQQKEHYGETWKNPCSRLKPDVDISWLGAIEAPCEPSARQWSCFNIWDMFPSSSTRFFFLPCPFTHIVLQFTHGDYAGKLPAIYCNYVKYQFEMVWMIMVGKRKENGKIEINIAAANAIITWILWNLSFRYISLYWSIHTKDESKRGTAFAFIFGVNWLWRSGVTNEVNGTFD